MPDTLFGFPVVYVDLGPVEDLVFRQMTQEDAKQILEAEMSDFGPIEIDLLRHQQQWIETRVQEIYPWESCPRCAEPENPEDGSCHVDHFFDWVRGGK